MYNFMCEVQCNLLNENSYQWLEPYVYYIEWNKLHEHPFFFLDK